MPFFYYMNNLNGEKIDKTVDPKISDSIKPLGKEKLMDYIEKYSFPRQIGTAGEKKVRKMAYKEFKAIGYKPHREEFICSLFFSIWFLRISLASFLTMIITNQILLFYQPAWNLAVFIVFIIWFFYIVKKSRKPHKMMAGKNYHSANIFAFLPAKSYGKPGNRNLIDDYDLDDNLDDYEVDDDFERIRKRRLKINSRKKMNEEKEEMLEIKKEEGGKEEYNENNKKETSDLPTSDQAHYGNIIFSAHTDSKSQSITTITRIYIFRDIFIIFIILFPVFLIGIFVDLFSNIELDFALKFLTILMTITLAFLTLMLFVNRSGNESPGALDNATGMAVVFALAEYFKDKPLERFNLWFVQFGVEEFGQMGARNWVLKRTRKFKSGRTFNFNFDMVAETTDEELNIVEFVGLNKKPVDPLMMSFVRESAKELGIEIFGLNLPTGAHTDRMVFAKYGYNGLDFASRSSATWTHSKDDTPDKVSSEKLEEAYKIVAKSVEKMDKALIQDNLEKIRNPKHIRHAYY